MAKPITFNEQNTLEGPAQNVPAYRDGAQIVTCHALSPEEIIEVINTGKVWVVNQGNSFPNLEVRGKYPFDKVMN